jgi:hypothetical protein
MSVIEAEFMGAVMIKEVSYECILNESYTQLSFSNHQQFVSASELHNTLLDTNLLMIFYMFDIYLIGN